MKIQRQNTLNAPNNKRNQRNPSSPGQFQELLHSQTEDMPPEQQHHEPASPQIPEETTTLLDKTMAQLQQGTLSEQQTAEILQQLRKQLPKENSPSIKEAHAIIAAESGRIRAWKL